MLRALLFLFCLVAGSHQLSVDKFQVPVSVESGSNAELQCQASKAENETGPVIVQWWWFPLHGTSENKSLFYQHVSGRAPQPLHLDHTLNTTTKGNDTVIIYNMEPKYSGTYECEVTNVKEIRRRNTLIVYSKGTGPQLNISIVPDGPDDDSDDDIILQCYAYDVAPYPDLAVTINGEDFKKLTETVSERDGVYNIYANATLTKDEIDGAEIRCELFYKNENVTHPAYVDVRTYQANGSRQQYIENTRLVALGLVTLLYYYTLK